MHHQTDYVVKSAVEYVFSKEEEFFITVDAKALELPLEGLQRLILGGKASAYLYLHEDGIETGISINRIQYELFINWNHIFAVEGSDLSLFVKQDEKNKKENKINGDGRAHLRLIKG